MSPSRSASRRRGPRASRRREPSRENHDCGEVTRPESRVTSRGDPEGLSPMTRWIVAAVGGALYVAAASWFVWHEGEAYRAGLRRAQETKLAGAAAGGAAHGPEKHVAGASGGDRASQPVLPEKRDAPRAEQPETLSTAPG